VILSIGFGTLILLIGLLGFGAKRRSQSLHDQTVSAHEVYLQTDAVLRDIPADLYLSDILIRDYLLDPSQIKAPAYREQLLLRRSSIRQRLDLLAQRPASTEDKADLEQLRRELQGYWESMDPILKWSSQEKFALSQIFLRQQVLPRREAVVTLARGISEINSANLQKEQLRLQGSQALLQDFLSWTVYLALGLGVLVAAISTTQVAMLERHSERQRERAEHAEGELRRLSRMLVRTQEEERKSLSRELHDAVGQMLSAMTMELGNLEAAMALAPSKFRERLDHARQLNAETLRGVRDLAMGLRPAMLDELGLGPALRWQAREFSRRSGIPVDVQIDGDLDGLPEAHRTCVYRIVQEGLTNCAKHARAKSIRISIYGRADWLSLSIQDDGAGFDINAAGDRGLGLIGIEERARELDGKVKIITQPGKGTIVEVELPVSKGVAAG
jgi:signal transduction histidine kinase